MTLIVDTVEFPYNGQFGSRHFVLYSEVVHFQKSRLICINNVKNLSQITRQRMHNILTTFYYEVKEKIVTVTHCVSASQSL